MFCAYKLFVRFSYEKLDIFIHNCSKSRTDSYEKFICTKNFDVAYKTCPKTSNVLRVLLKVCFSPRSSLFASHASRHECGERPRLGPDVDLRRDTARTRHCHRLAAGNWPSGREMGPWIHSVVLVWPQWPVSCDGAPRLTSSVA